MNVVYKNGYIIKEFFRGRVNEISVFPEIHKDSIIFSKEFNWIGIDVKIFDNLTLDEILIIFAKTFPSNIMELDIHLKKEIRELKLNKIIE